MNNIEKKKKGSHFISNIGENINARKLEENGYSRKEIKEILRDAMATLKWEIYESVPMGKKEEFSPEYYQQFIDEKMKEWPGFTYEEVQEKRYIEKEITSYEVPDDMVRKARVMHKRNKW